MNKTHSHFPISNEDYLFVLSTFVIDPIDWIDRFGWRKLSDNEQQSLFLFWRNVGIRMKLHSIPESLAQMESESWRYVKDHFAFDQANQQVAGGTIEIVKGWLPAMFKPFVKPVASALLDDRTRDAVGMLPPSWATRQAVHWSLKTRAALKRLARVRHDPVWPSGERTYPNGYQIDELAPSRILEIEKAEPLRPRD